MKKDPTIADLLAKINEDSKAIEQTAKEIRETSDQIFKMITGLNLP